MYLASWMIVAVTGDRFIAVSLPLRAGQWCTKRRSIITITIFHLFFATVNIYNFWDWQAVENAPEKWRCRLDEPTRKIRTFLICGLFSFVPALILFILNGIILKATSASRRRWTAQKHHSYKAPTEIRKSLNVLLLTTSFAFLFLTLPSALIDMFLMFLYIPSREKEFEIIFVREMFNILCMLNNCINFLLYCISGRRFRRELKKMVSYYYHRCRMPPKKPAIVISNSNSLKTTTLKARYSPVNNGKTESTFIQLCTASNHSR